jgi:hypothetical protein
MPSPNAVFLGRTMPERTEHFNKQHKKQLFNTKNNKKQLFNTKKQPFFALF